MKEKLDDIQFWLFGVWVSIPVSLLWVPQLSDVFWSMFLGMSLFLGSFLLIRFIGRV